MDTNDNIGPIYRKDDAWEAAMDRERLKLQRRFFNAMIVGIAVFIMIVQSVA